MIKIEDYINGTAGRLSHNLTMHLLLLLAAVLPLIQAKSAPDCLSWPLGREKPSLVVRYRYFSLWRRWFLPSGVLL